MATVTWTLRAARQLKKLEKPDQRAISVAVKGLAMWPECRNVKALTHRSDYRLRVGRFRVIFTVATEKAPVIVQIEEVKKRDEHTY